MKILFSKLFEQFWPWILFLSITCFMILVMIFFIYLHLTLLLPINRYTSESNEIDKEEIRGVVHEIALSKFSFERLDPIKFASSSMMDRYMKTIYQRTALKSEKSMKKKRDISRSPSSLRLSDDLEMIISLPNQNNSFNYYFDYRESLENLVRVELVLPIDLFKNISTMTLSSLSSSDLIILRSPFFKDRHWLKFDLTKYVRMFPQEFSLKSNNETLISSGFLVLYFQRISSHSIVRRDLSPFDDVRPATDNADSFNECAVRPYRLTFAELNWTSWIIEPTSYEMNICSGKCSAKSATHPYFVMQTFLHRLAPRSVTEPCCRPKRFTSTTLLFYDGPNLVLKRFENMSVVACACTNDS